LSNKFACDPAWKPRSWRLLGSAAPDIGGRNADLGFRDVDFKGYTAARAPGFDERPMNRAFGLRSGRGR